MIGDGAAGCERTWRVVDTPVGESLIVYGDNGGDTCHLVLDAEGRYRGRWLNHERMPVELTRHPFQLQAGSIADLRPDESKS